MPDAPLPPNALSERQLRWGIWLTTHRETLRRMGIVVLVLIGVGSWLFTLWGLVDHIFLDGEQLRRSVAELATPQNPRIAIIRQQQPHPITTAEVFVVPSGPGTYDIAARVVNPNPQWRAIVSYTLDVPGAAAEPMHTALLPGRDRWLVRLNVESTGFPSGATLAFSGITWDRVTTRTGPDVERYIRERLDLDIQDAAFIGPSALGFGTIGAGVSSGGVPSISRATFTVENRSAYGLLNPEFTVLLRRSGAIVGVNRVTMASLQSGETAKVAATWFHPLGLVTAAPDVIPYIDVFDQRSFLPI
ncbi:hypothetical protein HY480_04910 [Candidatus Uhrbacteria bacterium]|nr:hypothetical protein [Candidatus Uhrbacteria bacterium]